MAIISQGGDAVFFLGGFFSGLFFFVYVLSMQLVAFGSGAEVLAGAKFSPPIQTICMSIDTHYRTHMRTRLFVS